jgi:hypothetical protein
MSPDFRDLLSAFNAHRVEYLVVAAGRAQDLADLEWLERSGRK